MTWAVLTIWSGVLSHRQYPIRIQWRFIGLIALWALALDQWCLRGGLTGTGLANWLESAALPGFADMIAGGPLGEFKDGRIPELLRESSGLLASIIGNTLVALLFTLIIPVIHDGTRRRLGRFLPKRN